MRMLIAAVSVLLLSTIQQPTPNHGTVHNQAQISQQEKHAEPNPSISTEGCAQASNTQTKKDDPKPESHEWLYISYLISGPIVGIIALATGVLVWRQIVAIRNIERPWIAVTTIVHTKEYFKRDDGKHEVTAFTRWHFKNFGKTPAHIIEVGGAFKKLIKLEDLPAQPVYQNAPHFRNYTLLTPSTGSEDEDSPKVEIPYELFILENPDYAAVNLGTAFLVSMGFVKYKDPFGKI